MTLTTQLCDRLNSRARRHTSVTGRGTMMEWHGGTIEFLEGMNMATGNRSGSDWVTSKAYGSDSVAGVDVQP